MLSNKEWKEFADERKLTLSKAEIDKIVEQILNERYKGRQKALIDLISILLYLNPEVGMMKLRASGVFRIFECLDSNVNYPSLIVEHIRSSCNLQKLEKHVGFLDSVINISKLHGELRLRKQNIIKTLKQRKHTIIKSLYSFADSLFERNDIQCREELVNYSREQITEAVSYVVFLFDDLIGIKDELILNVDVDYIISGDIDDIVWDACVIKLIQEVEIEVDFLEYTCVTIDGNLRMQAPSRDFAVSYKYGNTLLDMHRLSRNYLDEETSASMAELARNVNKVTNGAILHYDNFNGVNRYAMAIPEGIFNGLYEEKEGGLLSPGYFKEEIRYLKEMSNELSLKEEHLRVFKIHDDFTFHDLLIVNRIFSFYSFAYFDLLGKKSKEDYYNSNIPLLFQETVINFLDKAVGKRKAEIYLDLFSYDGGASFLDIQYTPLLLGNKFYLIPYNILGCSNPFRNILFGKRIRLFSDGQIDPLSDKLEKALVEKGFFVKKGFSFQYNGKRSDVDVLAIKGNNIFVFECKNNLLPVNAFESRNMYSELKKAAFDQLPLSTLALADKDFLNSYKLSVGSINENIKVYSCIVTANRLFSGYEINGFQIRNINDLYTFISKGTFGLIDLQKVTPTIYSMWEGKDFDVQDLIEYLRKDTKYYRFIFDAFEEKCRKFQLKDNSLEYLEYELSDDKMLSEFYKMNWPKKDTN